MRQFPLKGKGVMINSSDYLILTDENIDGCAFLKAHYAGYSYGRY